MDDDESHSAAALTFVLTVRPESPGVRWQARLLWDSTDHRAEQRNFDSPLDLARFVAGISLPRRMGDGLR